MLPSTIMKITPLAGIFICALEGCLRLIVCVNVNWLTDSLILIKGRRSRLDQLYRQLPCQLVIIFTMTMNYQTTHQKICVEVLVHLTLESEHIRHRIEVKTSGVFSTKQSLGKEIPASAAQVDYWPGLHSTSRVGNVGRLPVESVVA